MARIRGNNHAFGWPGLESRWTHGDKDGVGTAYSAASRIWFTVWNGIVTEVYYPTVDTPQMRDIQLLFTEQSWMVAEARSMAVVGQGGGHASPRVSNVNGMTPNSSRSFIKRRDTLRPAFDACHLVWDTGLKGRTRKAATLTPRRSSQIRICLVSSSE